MKKRNYLGTFVYYYNILNYVISDISFIFSIFAAKLANYGRN